jgi:hypothetical protein
MEAICSSETSVEPRRITRRYILEDDTLQHSNILITLTLVRSSSTCWSRLDSWICSNSFKLVSNLMINIDIIIYGTTRFLKKRLWNLSVPRGDRPDFLQDRLRLFETKINCVLEPTVCFWGFFLFSFDLVITRNSKWSNPIRENLRIALF